MKQNESDLKFLQKIEILDFHERKVKFKLRDHLIQKLILMNGKKFWTFGTLFEKLYCYSNCCTDGTLKAEVQ